MWFRKIVVLSLTVSLIACNSDVLSLKTQTSEVLERTSENMVYVKGGRFTIGDSGDGVDKRYLTNISEVHSTKEIELSDYYINKYEVTWFEYVTFLKVMGLYEEDDKKSPYFGIKADEEERSSSFKFRPALSANWESANEYCKWLGLESGENYALPTEAQWEFAARSRGKKVFHAGEMNAPLKLDDYMRGEYLFKDKQTNQIRTLNASNPLAPVSGNALGEFESDYKRVVGSYPANELGLHDMVGNAQEWVADWYQYEYYPNMETLNPLGPKAPVEWAKFRNSDPVPKKVVRDWLYGGSAIQYGEVYARGSKPVNNSRTGFRCVKNISVEASSQNFVTE
jgi:formylglycine-generating enzyme required for sulfatase activity